MDAHATRNYCFYAVMHTAIVMLIYGMDRFILHGTASGPWSSAAIAATAYCFCLALETYVVRLDRKTAARRSAAAKALAEKIVSSDNAEMAPSSALEWPARMNVHDAIPLVTHAAAVVGACFAAAISTDNGLFLLAGFLLGIGYGVFGLLKGIDDAVAPIRLFVVTTAQVMTIFLLLR